MRLPKIFLDSLILLSERFKIIFTYLINTIFLVSEYFFDLSL